MGINQETGEVRASPEGGTELAAGGFGELLAHVVKPSPMSQTTLPFRPWLWLFSVQTSEKS